MPPDGSFLRPPKAFPIFKNKLLAKAEPDECFTAIGEPYPSVGKNGNCEVGTPKTNEGYLWGLTQVGNKLWFGTGANIQCTTGFPTGTVNGIDPYLVQSWVCEFGESQYAKPGFELIPGVTPVNAEIDDWRPPNAYEYDLTTGKLTVRTPTDPNFTKTFGIRSAGSLGDLVFLAGPALPNFRWRKFLRL